ncbi:MAG TPA: PIN domain-containing protein [Candidatus Dormibacteraeota bacterium]|nr:PIN domain-containing protein [Candidatus Dormibacteraeota bacterium]
MTLWLVDASVLLAREDLDDANHNQAVQLLAGPDPLATLDLAFYEVTNVAVRSWHDESAARRLCERISAVADDGGLVRADSQLLVNAALIAAEHGISAYDAAYVAAARSSNGQLVSCDVRDLVSRGLACLPTDAISGPPSPR